MLKFFKRPAELRAWFAKYADSRDELIVGYRTTGSGRPSITWPESVDEALCVGWIDGIRKRIDAESYQIRFTPRRKGSHWSSVNIARVAVLSAEGRMQPAGLAAFARRSETNARSASYEQFRAATFDRAMDALFRAEAKAWAWFEAQAPSYRQKLTWWVMSAKQQTTRDSRLKRLIESSLRSERL